MPYTRGSALLRCLFVATLFLAAPLSVLLVPPAGAVLEEPGQGATLQFAKGDNNFLEGERVRINVTGFTEDAVVRVRCVDCPDRDRVYQADARSVLVFPYDFTDGEHNARTDRQTRWKGEWRASLHPAPDLPSTTERSFHVHLVDTYRFPDNTAYPSHLLLFASGGYDRGESVRFVLKQRTADGGETVRWTREMVAPGPRVTLYWRIPYEEAERLICNTGVPERCQDYVFEVTSGAKDVERQQFRIEPARLRVQMVTGPEIETGFGADVAHVVERSTNQTLIAAIQYPDGTFLSADRLRDAARNPNATPSFVLEKVRDGTGRVLASWPLESRMVPGTHLWLTSWTIPKNETVNQDVKYRFVLERTPDRWGNYAPHTHVANFTIRAATLDPEVARVPEYVERTDTAVVDVTLRYHDGSPMLPSRNASAPTGFFQCEDREVQARCTSTEQYEAEVAHVENGTWRFTHTFPRTYPDVDFTHRFRMRDYTDEWGNQFNATEVNREIKVVPASPRIEILTTVGGEARNATRGLDRGDRVGVEARITYPSGAPFNATLNRHGAEELVLLLSHVTRDGTVQAQEDVVLRNRDLRQGVWTGSFEVGYTDDDAPLGAWTLHVRAEDITEPRANRNESTVTRALNPIPVRLVSHQEPGARVPIGAHLTYRFGLRYEDGTPVPPQSIGSDVRVALVEVDRAAGRDPVRLSGDLLPSYDPARKQWYVEWTVPREAYERTLAFRVQGEDRHGNPIQEESFSRAFTTYAEQTRRAVLTNPASEVRRGDTVFVVFDGQDGDTGIRGDGNVTLTLERFDPLRNDWVTERADALDANASGDDHVGRWETNPSSTLGQYRFILLGRDRDFREVHATSQSFRVSPTNLTRPLVNPPPDRIAKGATLTFGLAREPGDRMTNIQIHFNGRPVTIDGPISPPITQTNGDQVDVTWRVPFFFDNGNYTLTAYGYDLHGNRIVVEVPPIAVEPTRLVGQVLGNPARLTARDEAATFLFGVRFPDGDYFRTDEIPTVLVRNATGLVAQADVARDGQTYEATWTPSADTATGDYWFELTGTDGAGNALPPLRSDATRVVPGAFEREFSSRPIGSVARLSTVGATVPGEPTDAFVSFELVYLSSSGAADSAQVADRPGTSLGRLEHTIDPATGNYRVTWQPDRETRLGNYRIEFEGEDAHGNRFEGASRTFAVTPVTLRASYVDLPPNEDWAPGATVEYRFRVRYGLSDGAAHLVPGLGTPTANVEWNRQPALPRPEVTYDPEDEAWVASWTVPPQFPEGRYDLVVAGADDAGNPITPARSNTFQYEPTFLQSLTKVVPGTAHLGALMVLAVVALARRRKDD